MTKGKTNQISGVDQSTADAVVGDVKNSKTFFAGDVNKKTGTMPVHAANQTASAISNVGTKLQFTAPAGYYSGSKKVEHTDAEFIAANIRAGENLFGINGSLVPEPSLDGWASFSSVGSSNTVTVRYRKHGRLYLFGAGGNLGGSTGLLQYNANTYNKIASEIGKSIHVLVTSYTTFKMSSHYWTGTDWAFSNGATSFSALIGILFTT